jgi:NAD(P)-dependent dehydrogenase (short-subunit alcohol dehydrogenase family)
LSRKGFLSLPKALVTGANRGFGLALCRALVERGYDVTGACRTRSPELDRMPVRCVEAIDLSTDAGEQALAAALVDVELDLLVANAGIVRSTALDDLDTDAIAESIQVNALGALRSVRAALPTLVKGAKVVVISSLAGSIADNGSGREYGYRMSKAALNMASVSLARDLAPRGIAVGIFHPGRLAPAKAKADEETGVRMPVSPDVVDPLIAAREPRPYRRARP